MNQLFPLVVVLHETIEELETIKDLHSDPTFYGSYHAIVDRRGIIHYMVPSEHKAFAAANSRFVNNVTGKEESIDGSVDDFAYHIALETPPDGRDPNKESHSGYTYEQYNSTAWLLKAVGVQLNRVTTHGQVRDPVTIEPRCLNIIVLFDLYNIKTNDISISVYPVPLTKEVEDDDQATVFTRTQ